MDMEELILAEMKALAESVKPEWPILHQNKWLARSGLQKAIRRGRTQQAWACGDILFADDKAYAWKSLATVIVEDVGFGDPDLLSYAALSTLSTITNKMPSPKRLFMAMIGRACESDKTRSACELSLGAEKDPEIDWPAMRQLPPGSRLLSIPFLFICSMIIPPAFGSRDHGKAGRVGKAFERS